VTYKQVGINLLNIDLTHGPIHVSSTAAFGLVTGDPRCFHLSPGESTIRGSGGQRDGPAKSEKVYTDTRLYQVPVAISNNKTVGNGGINKSAAAAASPVGRACCGGSLEGEIRYGRTGQRVQLRSASTRKY